MKFSNINQRRKAFTIVELIIVMAVIAILSAVLIPTFTGITENARISSLKSEAEDAATAYSIRLVMNGETDDGRAIIRSDGDYTVIYLDGEFYVGNTFIVDSSETLNDILDEQLGGSNNYTLNSGVDRISFFDSDAGTRYVLYSSESEYLAGPPESGVCLATVFKAGDDISAQTQFTTGEKYISSCSVAGNFNEGFSVTPDQNYQILDSCIVAVKSDGTVVSATKDGDKYKFDDVTGDAIVIAIATPIPEYYAYSLSGDAVTAKLDSVKAGDNIDIELNVQSSDGYVVTVNGNASTDYSVSDGKLTINSSAITTDSEIHVDKEVTAYDVTLDIKDGCATVEKTGGYSLTTLKNGDTFTVEFTNKNYNYITINKNNNYQIIPTEGNYEHFSNNVEFGITAYSNTLTFTVTNINANITIVCDGNNIEFSPTNK